MECANQLKITCCFLADDHLLLKLKTTCCLKLLSVCCELHWASGFSISNELRTAKSSLVLDGPQHPLEG